MDIYSFVNSRDIRSHLRKINYQFSTLEVVWLILHCFHIGYNDKKKYWNDIINTTEDIKLKKRCIYEDGIDTIHKVLKDIISKMDTLIKEFYTESSEYVYQYQYLYYSDEDYSEKYNSVFYSFNDCFVHMKEQIEDLLDDNFPSEKVKDRILSYHIRKISLKDHDYYCEAVFLGNGDLFDLWSSNGDPMGDNYLTDYCFDFPTPFKKGDILYMPRKVYSHNSCGPVILDYIKSTSERMRDIGDESDMDICGLFNGFDGRVFHDVEQNYMDFEFYRKHFDESSKNLPLISKFIKGELPLDIFLDIYEKMLLEFMLSELRTYHLHMSDESLKDLYKITLDLDELNAEQDKLEVPED